MSVFGPPLNKWLALSKLAVSAAVIGTAPAAYAQSDDDISAELEALVDAAQSPETAIAAARDQIAANDLSGAASTLERALLANRNADEVRALYATILCRLDDPKGAQIEIDLLKGRNLSPDIASELRANCGLTPDALADSGSVDPDSALWGSVSVGLAYDTDTVGATNLQFISPFFFGRFQNDALSATGHLDLNARSPLGDGWAYASLAADVRFEAFGSVIGNGNNDYQSGELRFGYGHRSESTEFEIGPIVRHNRLFNNPYLNEVGGQARLSLLQEDDDEIVLMGHVVYEDFTFFGTGNSGVFLPPPNFASLRDGWNFDVSLASLNRMDDGFTYFGVGFEYKEANLRSYWSARLFAAAQKEIASNGSYLKASGVYRYVDFDARLFPHFPTAAPRNDHRFYFRGALGVPINDKGLTAEIGASFSSRLSSRSANIYDYDSVGIDAKLVWRF